MDDSALLSAQTHARKAAQETSRSRLGVAGSEHALAAEQYTKAAEGTDDAEALRILRLLEDHHHKLASIAKAREEFGRKTLPDQDHVQDHEEEVQEKTTAATPSTPTPERHQPPHLPKTRGDHPSSLAKDIASRRGIPPAPRRTTAPVSPVQATARLSNPSPASHSTPATRALSATTSHDKDDPPFDRFYTSLLTGPFSKLSSMLAFAGLPLHEAALEDHAAPNNSTSPTSSRLAAPGPDVTRLISKAALSALDQSRAFHPGESFYVIPPSGGTASYATMLSRNRDAAGPTEVGVNSVSYKADSGLREEELATENAALKQILDNLSRRLQAFESHAQDASIAMAQSVISVRPPRDGGHGDAIGGRAGHTAVGGEERIRELEARLEAEMKDKEALAKENGRNRAVINKYRSHWEQLKDSARARREKEGK